jgi:pyruvate,water dikinase
MSICHRLRELARRLTGPGEPEISPEEAERLSTLFRERYHSFRVLLAANGRALETMAVMEQAHGGSQPFGMDFVVSNSTSVAVRVYRMIRHLDILAPDKYTELFTRFDDIRGELDAIVRPPSQEHRAPLVLPIESVGRIDNTIVGAKMANLGEIHNAVGLTVPPGFVITAAAYLHFLEYNDLKTEIDRLMVASEIGRSDTLFELSSRLQRLVTSAEIPPDMEDGVRHALDELRPRLEPDVGFAVRSSAFGEDTADTSFAGLYDSQLNVHPDNLLTAYLEVAASKYTPQAMVYRHQHGLRDEDTEMAVGCMAMVDAAVGGVAYTTDPHDIADQRVRISAAVGLPKAVVDGRFDADLFIVERDTEVVVERRIVDQTTAFVMRSGEGITRREVPSETSSSPTLTDAQAREVARAALRLEHHFGEPQDVEWAILTDGRLVVLQARPMHHAGEPPVAPTIEGDPIIRGGVCVSPGVSGGRVSWVRSDRDALKFPNNGILVVDYPDPRWAALLDRAVAVVSEHGGIAGHLATVAREFGVPAIFGMGDLDALLRGDEITVDADGVAIHRGLVSGLEDARPRRNLMAGSPIHDTLGRALAHIVPLTLTDPSSTDFQPAKVQTLHDITRFCHEKAVTEMFSFGRDHSFPRYAAKQLHHNVPMQWWVLDLDDGFTREINGKYVHLEEITCVPMRALWDGMVAIPWDGPPAITGSGFASVLFEATRNPALSTPFRKPYAQRNYFMVSANFMNLQSRFGFHFSTVEALASERDSENYLVFSLKGGAADMDRRSGRARFIAEILEVHGFQLNVVEDTVTARAWAMPRDEILSRLKIIGYLLMHTRQLDMVMGDPRSVERYRAKFASDIAAVVGRQASA